VAHISRRNTYHWHRKRFRLRMDNTVGHVTGDMKRRESNGTPIDNINRTPGTPDLTRFLETKQVEELHVLLYSQWLEVGCKV